MAKTKRATYQTFSLERLTAASDVYNGFCTACGAEHEECEPDCRERKCDNCGQLRVYGAEELMLMGLAR